MDLDSAIRPFPERYLSTNVFLGATMHAINFTTRTEQKMKAAIVFEANALTS